MTVYAIAQLSIRDRGRYQSYVARFLPTLRPYGGRLLAADEQPEVIEGEWDRHKVILLAFPDRDQFTAWANSPEYVDISRDRLAATDGPVLLVQGIPG